jgi:general stress protein 26
VSDVSEQDPKQKVGELIKDIRTTMMTTIDESGAPRSRPMYTQEAEFDGDLWFLADAHSSKMAAIAHNPRVNLGYANPSKERYVSVTGSAKIVDDRSRVQELWKPFLKAWWEGPEDRRIRVIKVEVEQVEYWDSPGRFAYTLAIARSALSGKRRELGENETIDFQDSMTR